MQPWQPTLAAAAKVQPTLPTPDRRTVLASPEPGYPNSWLAPKGAKGADGRPKGVSPIVVAWLLDSGSQPSARPGHKP